MRYIFLVAWREFFENAKTKGFWIGLLIFPLTLFLSIQVPIWLESKGTPVRYFVVVDQSGDLSEAALSALERDYQKNVLEELNDYARRNADHSKPESADEPSVVWRDANPRSVEAFMAKGGEDFYLAKLKARLRPEATPFKSPRRMYQRVELPGGVSSNADLTSIAQGLRPFLRGERKIERQGQWVNLSAALLIPVDLESRIVRPGQATAPSAKGKGIEYWSGNLAETRLRDQFEQALNTEIRRREYIHRGIDASVIKDVQQTYAPYGSFDPKKEAGRETVGTVDVMRQWAPSAFVYLLWVAIFSIIQMLLGNTIEEKSNRIIEVLLSSVTPGELMLGKLCGIAAIGLTMVGVWIAALFGILAWKSGGASQMAGQMFVVLKSSNLVPMFAIYFILGYLLYAALILSLGSVCNTLKDAQNYMAAITTTMMVPLLTMMFIPKDPNGVVARVLSWIPIYTPFTMMNRATSDPPLVDLVGTMVLLAASAAAALWMTGKIFRIGILRTGQPPRILEMLRWLRRP